MCLDLLTFMAGRITDTTDLRKKAFVIRGVCAEELSKTAPAVEEANLIVQEVGMLYPRKQSCSAAPADSYPSSCLYFPCRFMEQHPGMDFSKAKFN